MVKVLSRPPRRLAKLVVPVIAFFGVMGMTGTAHAEWHYTKGGAEKIAKRFVASHYANTDAANLTAYCRPQGRRAADARYKYHRWVCGWYDESDDTAGSVVVVGSTIVGGYYAHVRTG